MLYIMEKISVKVLIIGGGPSGSACGITLQKAGIDCCIVDKAKFPRVKLCAGLFTHKSQKCLLDILGKDDYADAMQHVLVSKEEEFGLWYREKNLMSSNQPKTAKLLGVPDDGTGWDGHIHLVDRPAFDNYLFRYYQKLGGKLIEGDGLKDIDFAGKMVTLSSGQTISYEYLVAADGAASRIEHKLKDYDKTFQPKGVGMNTCLEINVDREDLDRRGVHIYFGIIPNSYAWLFSKGKKVCLGLCRIDNVNADLQKAMRDFCTILNLKHPEKYPFKGALLPFGNVMKNPLWQNHLLFVGDAAGLVEPLTGEGIFYALQSGHDAARSLICGNVSQYITSVKELYAIIKKGIGYQKLLESKTFSKFLFEHAPKNERFITYFYHTQIEQRSATPFWATCLKYKLTDKKKMTR